VLALVRTKGDDFHAAMPELNAVISAVYVAMSRIQTRLQQPLHGLEQILRAWVVETERALIDDGKAGDLVRMKLRQAHARFEHNVRAIRGHSNEDHILLALQAQRDRELEQAAEGNGAGLVRRAATTLWGYTSRGGISVEALINLLAEYSAAHYTPPLVAEVQNNGVRHYYSKVVPVLAEALRLDDKRIAYEVVRHAILMDEDLSDIEDAITEATRREEAPKPVSVRPEWLVVLPKRTRNDVWGPLLPFFDYALGTVTAGKDKYPDSVKYFAAVCRRFADASDYCVKAEIDLEDLESRLSSARFSQLKREALEFRGGRG
jgi:hypothetical protein